MIDPRAAHGHTAGMCRKTTRRPVAPKAAHLPARGTFHREENKPATGAPDLMAAGGGKEEAQSALGMGRTLNRRSRGCAEVSPIDVGPQLFAAHSARSGTLDGWAHFGRYRSVSLGHLADHGRGDVQDDRHLALRANQSARSDDWAWGFFHDAEFSIAKLLRQAMLNRRTISIAL